MTTAREITKDMTRGHPGRLIFGFALPLMLGNLFQQLYTFGDTMVVGQALGVEALAALGGTEWMTFMMFGCIQGLVQGFSVVMAQYYGAADYGLLKRSITNAVYLSLAGAVILTISGQAMIAPMLHLIHTPAEITGMSERYLRILYGGIPVTILYNLSAAVLRAIGNSKIPLQAMVIASLCNIVLDIILVFGFHAGIEGAAWATVVSQILASVFCGVHLKNVRLGKFEKADWLLKGEICIAQLKLGIPMGLQNIITAVGGLVVQSVVNTFGVLFLAGYTAAVKIYGLLETAASSYGYAVSTYTGQNYGAGLMDRIRKGLRAANIIGGITALVMSGIMVFFGRFLLSCFITGDPASVMTAIRTGYDFLLILAMFFPLLYWLYIMRACLQGMGNSILPMLSSIGQLVMRIVCAVYLTKPIGESGVFYGEVSAWLLADCMLVCSYLCHMKNKKGKCRNGGYDD